MSKEREEQHSMMFACVNHWNWGFTLVELLIVVALLGALAALMLPSLKVNKKQADTAVLQSEMHEVQKAFVRFYNDCLPSPAQINEMTNIYFAPLIDGAQYDGYDAERNRGWRGPYAIAEGTHEYDGTNYPALLDPNGGVYEIFSDQTNLFMRSGTNCPITNRPIRQLTFNE